MKKAPRQKTQQELDAERRQADEDERAAGRDVVRVTAGVFGGADLYVLGCGHHIPVRGDSPEGRFYTGRWMQGLAVYCPLCAMTAEQRRAEDREDAARALTLVDAPPQGERCDAMKPGTKRRCILLKHAVDKDVAFTWHRSGKDAWA